MNKEFTLDVNGKQHRSMPTPTCRCSTRCATTSA